MHKQLKRHAGALLLALGAATATMSADSIAQEISTPEKILFLSNHFKNTKEQKLNYTYRRESEGPDAFDDEVSLDILEHHADGTVSVAAHFLSGERKVSLPPIDQAEGNPVILGFLERDISEMKNATGGAVGYFRKRIRMALASPDLTVKKLNVSYDGHQVAAQEITIHPYADDPLRERFGKYADKAYVFVLSDAVPGSLYRMYTTLKDESSKEKLDTTMTIARGVAAE